MIYAVPSHLFDQFEADGTNARIQDLIINEKTEQLAELVQNGQLVEARSAESHPKGDRDRCYICGDEVIKFRWSDKIGNPVCYFKHVTNRDCIGQHRANPSAVHQPCA